MSNALGYTSGSIADVELKFLDEDIKVNVLDGGGLLFNVTGVNSFAADGTVVQQLYTNTFAGVSFGVQVENFPIPVFKAVIEAVVNALVAGASFVVSLKDDFYDFTLNCTWDFAAAPKGPTVATQRIDATYVKDVTLRFIVVD